jgi:hypothetical protein
MAPKLKNWEERYLCWRVPMRVTEDHNVTVDPSAASFVTRQSPFGAAEDRNPEDPLGTRVEFQIWRSPFGEAENRNVTGTRTLESEVLMAAALRSGRGSQLAGAAALLARRHVMVTLRGDQGSKLLRVDRCPGPTDPGGRLPVGPPGSQLLHPLDQTRLRGQLAVALWGGRGSQPPRLAGNQRVETG